MKQKELYSARLYCRPISPLDLEQIAILYNDERVNRFTANPQGLSEAEVKSMLEAWKRHWEQHEFGPWLICDASSKEMIGLGGISLRNFDDYVFPNLWYRLSPKVWGRAYASEFVGTCLTWFAKHHSQLELHALVKEENIASIRILEKNRMVRVGSLLSEKSGASLHYRLPSQA